MLKDGYVADTIPNTVWEIRARIERNAQEQFIIRTVPEILFWEIGLEYIGNDTITFEVKP